MSVSRDGTLSCSVAVNLRFEGGPSHYRDLAPQGQRVLGCLCWEPLAMYGAEDLGLPTDGS